MKQTLLGALFLAFSLSAFQTKAQNAGRIVAASSPVSTILDPNGDGWATDRTLIGCAAPPASCQWTDDFLQSELKLLPMPGLNEEVNGDLSTSGSCGQTEIVHDGSGGSSAYILYQDVNGIEDDGDDVLIFRLRIAKNSTGNFAYVVLLDTDLLIGAGVDPNAVDGNPGFEYEVRVNTGGQEGVRVFDVDGGGKNDATAVAGCQYAGKTNYQRIQAVTNSCAGETPVFYDFYVPISCMNLTVPDNIRLATATVSSGNSALSGSASDIGFVNDDDYADQDDAFVAIINAQGGGTGVGQFQFPVELVSFTAQRNSLGVVELNWLTATEINNNGFEIQRSADLKTIQTLSFVQGSGTIQTPVTYRFRDENAPAETVYYRLKQMDFDGKFEYSNWIEVSNSTEITDQMSVWPNPVENDINLKLSCATGGETTVILTNAAGKQFYNANHTTQSGLNTISLPALQLPRGVYFLEARSANYRHKISIVR